MDIYEKSNNDIIVELGRRFRDYRIALRMTQKEVAEQSGVSIMTIVRFENGEGVSIGLNNFVALLRTIQRLEDIAGAIPYMPISLYEAPISYGKINKRVKKRKNEK